MRLRERALVSTTACKLPAALLTPAGALSLGSRVPRQYHEVCVWDDKLWVLAGANWGGATVAEARGPRSGDTATMEVNPITGKPDANRNDVWYSEDGATWHELEGTPWDRRHASSVFVFDDALWMTSGNVRPPSSLGWPFRTRLSATPAADERPQPAPAGCVAARPVGRRAPEAQPVARNA